MKVISLLGIDLAKDVFQLHGVDSLGKAVLKKRLGRAELLPFLAKLSPCLIGVEVCGGSNYWAREFEKLGHTAKQIAPQFVKPYRKSNKNDANDAEAICEALSRPNMRFVPTKRAEDQDTQSLHRIRQRLISQRTGLSNEIRGFLLEYGIALPKNIARLRKEIPFLAEDKSNGLTDPMRVLLSQLREEMIFLDEQISSYDEKIKLFFKSNELCQRISKVAGVGIVTATALVASSSALAKTLKNGRQFSAALGLVPRQNSSGNKEQLLSITKTGDNYVRCLLIHGARSAIRTAAKKEDKISKWVTEKVKTRGHNRACVALANKNARIIWVLIAKGADYQIAA